MTGLGESLAEVRGGGESANSISRAHNNSAEPMGSRDTLRNGNPTNKVQVFYPFIKDDSIYSQLSLLIQAMLSSWESSIIPWMT